MTFKIGSMHNIPDWLWNQWNTPDWYWKGLVVWATGWVTGKTIEWAWQHRKELGEISNNLRYKLGESSRPIIKTSSAISRISTSAQAVPQIIKYSSATSRISTSARAVPQVKTVTLSGRSGSAGGATANIEVGRKKPRTKQEHATTYLSTLPMTDCKRSTNFISTSWSILRQKLKTWTLSRPCTLLWLSR